MCRGERRRCSRARDGDGEGDERGRETTMTSGTARGGGRLLVYLRGRGVVVGAVAGEDVAGGAPGHVAHGFTGDGRAISLTAAAR